MFLSRRRSLAVSVTLPIALLAILGAGCGQTPPDYSAQYDALIGSCKINDNQRGSFMAPDDSTPIQVIEDSDFSSDELKSISSAVDEWNRYGNSVSRGNMFTATVGSVPSDIKTATTLSCDQSDWGDPGSFHLVRLSDPAQWKALGFSSSVPAATLRCYSDGALTQQVIIFRPDLVDPTQITTVILHELGHSLGLEHSCASGSQTSTSWASCSGLASTDPYFEAVMYPTIQLGDAGSGSPPQTKNQLSQNDEDRANCYYKSGQ